MAQGTRSPNEVVEFASPAEAKAFLAQTLPVATAANPKYRSDNSGAETQWLTKDIRFDAGENADGVLVTMNESVLRFNAGVPGAVGTHQAVFTIEDVRASELKDATDLTSDGQKALGILFNCKSGKCIRSNWDGVASTADWTDIYIQDDGLRAAILEAFQTLERAAGQANPPAAPKSP